MLQPEISLFKSICQQKVGPKSRNHFTNPQTMCEINIRNGIVSTKTVSETVITEIQRVQNSFIRIALCLPKYMSACSGLQYLRERLIIVGQNHLARMHANPYVEHTINSAWDKCKTPISILKPPD